MERRQRLLSPHQNQRRSLLQAMRQVALLSFEMMPQVHPVVVAYPLQVVAVACLAVHLESEAPAVEEPGLVATDVCLDLVAVPEPRVALLDCKTVLGCSCETMAADRCRCSRLRKPPTTRCWPTRAETTASTVIGLAVRFGPSRRWLASVLLACV